MREVIRGSCVCFSLVQGGSKSNGGDRASQSDPLALYNLGEHHYKQGASFGPLGTLALSVVVVGGFRFFFLTPFLRPHG